MIIDFAQQPSNLNNVDCEKIMEITLDTGAVAHVAAPEHLPGLCQVRVTDRSKGNSFVAANGTIMENQGEATVAMADLDAGENVPEAGCTFQVLAQVTRPLHAAAPITDNNKEILIMKGEAVVVRSGTFSKFLDKAKVLQRYKRKGNLYTNKVRAKPMNMDRGARPSGPDARTDQGFTGQGKKR